MKKVVIIGGGLAGLVASIKLIRADVPCCVIEKKSYPFHRVCGEYISNETVPFLQHLELYPREFNPPQINRFRLSSVNGKNVILPLDLGGFGISRYAFDQYLFQKAKSWGVEFMLNTEVENITFQDEKFTLQTSTKKLEADVVLGAFGKRSKIDSSLSRTFLKKRSPYLAVKYHIRTDVPEDLISLHNFKGGYCGMSRIEDGKTNLCYLSHRDNLKQHGNIKSMEEAVLFKNPLLQEIFSDAEFLFSKPEVINEVSFETKSPVEDHVLMVGDSAGMITPLCGNGMAMAMHAAKIASELTLRFCSGDISRNTLEKAYATEWNRKFARRLWLGRQVQNLFGNHAASVFAVNLALHSKPVANAIIRNTHGERF